MREIGAYEAKTHLAEPLDSVSRGESIKISRHGKTVALLVPPTDDKKIPAPVVINKLRHLRKHATLGGLSLQSFIEAGQK